MNFSEKLYKLRKESGMSQEELAEKLNTSRQAVSKWENDQGYPETEKIRMLGNIFEVSIDFLLKDSDEEGKAFNKGYYVRKEVAYKFLRNEKQLASFIAAGACFLLLTGVPYVLLQKQNDVRVMSMAVCVAIAVGFFVCGAFKDVGTYKVLKKEALIFDSYVLKDLKQEYHQIEKRYTLLSILGIMLIVLGFIPIIIVVKGYMGESLFTTYHVLCFLAIAFGFLCFIIAVSTIDAYKILIDNEEYNNRQSVKLLRNIRKSMDDL